VKVALDRQHQGKPSARADRGAVFPDGTTEAAHAEHYGLIARSLLEARGVEVVWLTNGEYRDRNAAANAARCDLYVALHVNAGATDPSHVYALTEYVSDAGMPAQSQRAAAVLLAQAAKDLNERAVGPHALRSGDRGHICIAGCRMPAVIYEPEFTIAARADSTVGESLARGIASFLGLSQTAPRKVTVHNYLSSLVAPNGGTWHLQADGGVITDTDGLNGPEAPFYGSVPGAGGAGDARVRGILPHGQGYKVVVQHPDESISYFHFPAS
jgi:hypothetical protein